MHIFKNLFLIVLALVTTEMAQSQDLELLTPLSTQVSESSALIFLEGKLITLNDSGGLPVLYEIDSLSGDVLRTVFVANAENTDWEALTFDDAYLYIGDFGNNNGTRTDLKVFRVSRNDYFQTANDTVQADQISFHYADQSDFSSAPLNTNFDAEAMAAIGDSLYIFTKNWANFRTNIYPLAKIPGDYSLEKTDSIDVQGLITDAAYNAATAQLMLSGYTPGNPFALSISNFQTDAISEGTMQSTILSAPSGYSYQIEGVTGIAAGLVYFTSEGGFVGDAALFKLELQSNSIQTFHPSALKLFPNPAGDYILVQDESYGSVTILTLSGKPVLQSNARRIDISTLPTGLYLAKAYTPDKQLIATRKLVVD